MRKSQQLSLIAIFGALHAVLYYLSFGLWRNWGIYLGAIEGIILGPASGATAALIGSLTARMIKPDPLWMFGIVAEPLSVMAAGFLMKGKWKPVLALNAVMLTAYFIHPFGRLLPLWTILDVLLAFLLIYPAARLGKKLFETDFKLPIALILISFVSIATDSLVRIFLLIPAGIYNVFPDIFGGFDGLHAVFIGAAVDSYIEDLIVVAVSVIVGAPLLLSLSKLKLFRNNRSTKKD